MQKAVISFVALLAVTLSFGQDFSIISQKTVGGTGHEIGNIPLLFDPHNEEAFFLITSSYSGVSGDKTEFSRGGSDVWLVKLDSDFNVLWDKAYGGEQNETPTSAFVTEDYIIVSASSSSNQSGDKTMDLFGNMNIWMLCLDHSGNLLWQGQYGGSLSESSPRILPYTDTSFLMFCSSNSPVSGNKTVAPIGGSDIWIVEIEYATGDIIRQKIIGSQNDDSQPRVMKSSNGNYLLSMQGYEGVSGDKTDVGFGWDDIWVVELDENIEIIQDKCFGGDRWDYVGEINEIGDYYYLTATSESGISGNKTEDAIGLMVLEDIWLVKMDKDLNIIWDRTIGGTNWDSGRGIFMGGDGKLVLYGLSKSIEDGNKTAPYYGVDTYDTWIVLLSQDGELLEQFTIGGYGNDSGIILPHSTDPSKLLFCATTDSPAGTGNKTAPTIGGRDIWLGVIDASNVLGITGAGAAMENVSVFPNPSKEVLYVRFDGHEASVWLTDVNGKQVTKDFHSSMGAVDISVNDLTAGIYLIHIQSENGQVVKKVIVE